VNAQDLKGLFNSLRTWSQRDSFSSDDWRNYMKVAKIVQGTDPPIVEGALDQFVLEATHESFTGYTSESKPFLLMRVVFDLPEVAAQQLRLLFKGWANWPQADAQGNVSLAWPISWQSGRPELAASYEGMDGKPYSAVAEYRYLRDHFPYRRLGDLEVKQ
jgi:hypothetical protein